MHKGSMMQGRICGWNNGAVVNCTSNVGWPIGNRLDPLNEFVLNDYCKGFSQLKNNYWNYSIISKDPNTDIFTNEYLAGYIQGKLQGAEAVKAARNNTWHNTYLCSASGALFVFVAGRL